MFHIRKKISVVNEGLFMGLWGNSEVEWTLKGIIGQ